jgi:hypothetical protein
MKICNYKLYPNDLLNLIGLGHFKNAPFFQKLQGSGLLWYIID